MTAAVVGINAGRENIEMAKEDTVETLTAGPTKEVFVEQGDTIWGFYEKSGYTHVSGDTYTDAVRKLNPELENQQLQANSRIIVPWKSPETGE